MDDPIFDPWSVDGEEASVEGAADTPQPRWRSRAAPTPRVPPPFTPTVPSQVPPSRSVGPESLQPGAPTPRGRLAGTAGFLRSMAVPRLLEIVRQLEMARHEAQVDDQLDDATPVLRLRLRAWRGPWTAKLSPPVGALELRLEGGPDGEVWVRQWLDLSSDEPSEESRIPVTKVSAAWLQSLALRFVEGVLSRA